ncbi:hypothetical protein QFC21_003204 [Naganishia friedmannii]|uniref:Uncharacterized protein n=1 Tax=Naganishia friedmannii TaxID=89922 RepID=A0ACC2VS99_9TREE|nr:hypothetical protein QFC21_003204 [Naganishia friedmannii]
MSLLLTYIHSLPSNIPLDASDDECGHKPSCLAAQQRIKNNPNPELDLYTASSRSSSKNEPVAEYPVDYWFWLLYFAIPYGFTCRMAIIETFEAVFHGRPVYKPEDVDNTCWSDPLATFIYIACELLLPIAPFGGIGGHTPVLLAGKMRLRDKVIAKIVTAVMMSDKYSARQSSNYRQRIIGNLLSQYSDSSLPGHIREYAIAALQRFAQSTRIITYNSGYVDKIPECNIKHGACTNYRLTLIAKHLTENGWIPLPANSAKQHLHPDGNLVIHPFLAFFLSLPGYHCQSDDIHSYVVCDPKRHGKAWWEWYVMRHPYRKVEYASRWWANDVSGEKVRDSVFYIEYGEPPTNNEGPFVDRFTPKSHLFRRDCAHCKIAGLDDRFKINEDYKDHIFEL